jgi:4-aminobutyrate aminotransferase / (S)-3-amino-2-methylpropionate transaminase / 5-aminovalerate transaminase
MAVEPTTGAETARLSEARERYVARGIATSGLFVEHAHGATIVDVDGREYIDFVGGIGCLNGGHTPETVVSAVREQAERYLHQCFSVGMYEPYIEVCRRICELHPGSFATKALLQNSGAEAVENAVKIARYATGRDAIVCFDQAFHGRTLMTMSLTSKVMPYKTGFGPFAPEVYRAASPWPYRGIGTDEALASIRKLFKSQVDPQSVAALIYEPVQGEGGFLPATPGFLEGIQEICREHGIVYIDDEVQSGMGRTGKLWALDHYGLVPDLMTVGKSLAAGMPLAGVVGRADIIDSVHPGGLGSTYGGNPVACAAAVESIKAISSPDFLAHATSFGEEIMARLHAMAERHAVIGEVRGIGPMAAIELVKDPDTREPASDVAAATVAGALERGLLLLKTGIYDNVLRILVPITATEEDLNLGLDRLEESLAAAA